MKICTIRWSRPDSIGQCRLLFCSGSWVLVHVQYASLPVCVWMGCWKYVRMIEDIYVVFVQIFGGGGGGGVSNNRTLGSQGLSRIDMRSDAKGGFCGAARSLWGMLVVACKPSNGDWLCTINPVFGRGAGNDDVSAGSKWWWWFSGRQQTPAIKTRGICDSVFRFGCLFVCLFVHTSIPAYSYFDQTMVNLAV